MRVSKRGSRRKPGSSFLPFAQSVSPISAELALSLRGLSCFRDCIQVLNQPVSTVHFTALDKDRNFSPKGCNSSRVLSLGRVFNNFTLLFTRKPSHETDHQTDFDSRVCCQLFGNRIRECRRLPQKWIVSFQELVQSQQNPLDESPFFFVQTRSIIVFISKKFFVSSPHF